MTMQSTQPKSDALASTTSAPQSSGLMALEPRNIGEGQLLAGMVARAKLFGVTSPDDAFVRMATGMGLGLSAWQSLRGLFVISGKVGLAADLMLALCLSSPDCEYFRCTETTAERATFVAKRRSDPEPMRLTFTMEEARQAKLVQSGGMYDKFPANMLRARCTAFLARLMFPERMHGIYTREEIDGIETEREREPRNPQAITVAAEPPTELRSSAASPLPPALVRALAAWDKSAATEEEVEMIAASKDPNHRAMVFDWRIGLAADALDLAALAYVVIDIANDPHVEMRTAMRAEAEKARIAMVGAEAAVPA